MKIVRSIQGVHSCFSRLLRLILAGVMFITLFLPLNPPPEVIPNWLFILWSFWEALPGMVGKPTIVNLVGWLMFLLGVMSVPLLVVLNGCLAIYPSRRLKTPYRILLPILLLLTWYGTFRTDPERRGLGFWANIAVVSAAALLEIVFVLWERREKSGGTGLETA